MSNELKALQLVKAIRPEILPHIAEMARKGVHPFPPLEPVTPPKPSRHPSEAYPVNMDAIRRANEGGRTAAVADTFDPDVFLSIQNGNFTFEGDDDNVLTMRLCHARMVCEAALELMDSDPPTPEPFRPVAGRDCITRDGRRVTEVWIETGRPRPVRGHLGDPILAWDESGGRKSNGIPHKTDLVGFWEDGE